MTTFTTEDRISATIEQGSDAWLQLRLGKVTASRVADVLAKTKTGPSASRANYLIELAIPVSYTHLTLPTKRIV